MPLTWSDPVLNPALPNHNRGERQHAPGGAREGRSISWPEATAFPETGFRCRGVVEDRKSSSCRVEVDGSTTVETRLSRESALEMP